MEHRNMLCSNQMVDMEINQQAQGHIHPEPSILYGNVMNFPAPSVHTMLPAPGIATNVDAHHLLEYHDCIFYGMTHYNGVQHHHPATNHDLSVATASGHCNPYLIPPSSSRVFRLPVNHGSHEQSQLSGNHDVIGVPTDPYGRNGYFKRKNAEGILGNFQHFNVSGGSSSSVALASASPLVSEFTAMDASSLSLPEYRGNNNPLIVEVGSNRSVRNRCGAIGLDSAPSYNTVNHLIQGSYLSHPLQTAGGPWLNQQFNGTTGGVGDIASLTWNQAPPALSYLQGGTNGGCAETGNIGVQGYQVTPSIRSSSSFLHPTYISQGHPNLHHPPPPPQPPIQGLRGQNIDMHPQVATSSHRLVTNSSSHPVMNTFQEGLQTASRFVGSVPSTGFRIYRPHQRALTLEPSFRQRNFPHLRVLPEDGVATLEIPGYHEIRDAIDHHRDMRLDIDHMSYEELLALGEQMGSVETGFLEETIESFLKTRTFTISSTPTNHEEAVCMDQEINFCVICQTNYMDQESVGTLDCGHEYHVDCVKKWLRVKSSCPICKSTALPVERKD